MKKFKVGDKLYCHSVCKIDGNDNKIGSIIGNTYIIIDVDYDNSPYKITINDDLNNIHDLTIKNDCYGKSYKTWFCDLKIVRKKKLKRIENGNRR